MPRIPSAALSVVADLPLGAGRPEPPRGLTAAEKRQWRAIVGSKPAGWFDASSIPLLAEYCSTITSCERISREIRNAQKLTLATDEALARVDRLYRIRERQQRQALQLATRMRLTQQAGRSASTPGAKGHIQPPGTRKPWDV